MIWSGDIPYVAFITDFGLNDSYVCELHAVLFSICPQARVFDVTHGIAPGDVKSAAYTLERMSGRLPFGTIFVAVVDPGVGTERQAVILRCMDRYFVGPDNGLFSRIIMDKKPEVRVIDWNDVGSGEGSATFHGRDLFTPVAGRLACRGDFNDIGKPGELIDTYPANRAQLVEGGWVGNVITNLLNGLTGRISIRDQHDIESARNYAEQPANKLFWLSGSGRYIEISMNGGSAAAVLGVKIGASVRLEENVN